MTIPSTAPRWARWFTYASFAVAGIALVLTFVMSGPRTIVNQLVAIGPWFGLVIAIEVLGTCCDANALRLYLGSRHRRPGFGHVLRAHVAGRAVSLVTPLGSLGELTKTTILMEGTSTDRAIAAVARWNLTTIAISLAAIVIVAPICAWRLSLPTWIAGVLYIGAALAALLFVVGVTLIRRGVLTSAVNVLVRLHIISRARRKAWRPRLRSIDQQLRGRGYLPVGAAPFGWLVLSRALTWLGLWVVMAASGTFAGVGTMAALATAGTVISWASTIVPLGFGVSEGGNAALFSALGHDPALGVTLVLARRMIQLLYAAVGLSFFATTGTIEKARKLGERRARNTAEMATRRDSGAVAYPRAS